jgi:hypothetical protein
MLQHSSIGIVGQKHARTCKVVYRNKRDIGSVSSSMVVAITTRETMENQGDFQNLSILT